MLKRNVYTDFGQFVAALKSAERLGLHYRVERKAISARVRIPHLPTRSIFNPQGTTETTWTEEDSAGIAYTLDLLPDEEATEDTAALA